MAPALKRLNGEEVKILPHTLGFAQILDTGRQVGRFNATPNTQDRLLNVNRENFSLKIQGQASLNAESLSRSTKSVRINPESISGQIEADPIYISYPINIGSDPALPIICNSSFLMTDTGVFTIHNVNSNAECQPPVK